MKEQDFYFTTGDYYGYIYAHNIDGEYVPLDSSGKKFVTIGEAYDHLKETNVLYWEIKYIYCEATRKQKRSMEADLYEHAVWKYSDAVMLHHIFVVDILVGKIFVYSKRDYTKTVLTSSIYGSVVEAYKAITQNGCAFPEIVFTRCHINYSITKKIQRQLEQYKSSLGVGEAEAQSKAYRSYAKNKRPRGEYFFTVDTEQSVIYAYKIYSFISNATTPFYETIAQAFDALTEKMHRVDFGGGNFSNKEMLGLRDELREYVTSTKKEDKEIPFTPKFVFIVEEEFIFVKEFDKTNNGCFLTLAEAFEHLTNKGIRNIKIRFYLCDATKEQKSELGTEFEKLVMIEHWKNADPATKSLKEVLEQKLGAPLNTFMEKLISDDGITESLLLEAHNIVHKDSLIKEREYGKFDDMVTRCTAFAKLLLNKPEFNELEFLKVLISLKLGRWSHSNKEDTLLDLLAYIGQYTKTVLGK